MSSRISVPIGQNITEAVLALRQGQLLGFPTETVYGLGADALNEAAVAAVFAAKGRPIDHPLIVHLAGPEALNQWAIDIPPLAQRLAEAFWPGPLTLVLKKHPRVPMVVTGGQDTVALRVPNHPVCLSLLRAFGGGIVGPSANRYQRVSPTSAQDVSEELGEKLAYVLDGGACQVGIESTIVSCDSEGSVQILRQGAVSPEALRAAIQSPISIQAPVTALTHTAPRVPGSGVLHYAPEKPVFMSEYDELLAQLLALMAQPESTKMPLSVLAFSAMPATLSAWTRLDWQIMPRDPVVYQQQLYRRLRAFDKSDAQQLWIEAVPKGVDAWLAVQDRLRRATAGAQLSLIQNKSKSLGRFF
jgi:L-threonylcarbamoyladenylate synthase